MFGGPRTHYYRASTDRGGLFGPLPLAGGPPELHKQAGLLRAAKSGDQGARGGPGARYHLPPPGRVPGLEPLPEFLSLRFLKTETMTSRLPKMSTTVVKISTLESTVTTQAGRGAPAASRSAKPKRPRPPGSQQFLRDPFSSIVDALRSGRPLALTGRCPTRGSAPPVRRPR